jgi:hypothetical protein
MNMIASKLFHFYTRQNLTYLTTKKAANLRELLEGLKEVSAASIYHHTHRFLQQHEFLSPEPPNDFAYWTSHVLQDEELGERIASIDFLQIRTLEDIRTKLIEVLEEFATSSLSQRTAPSGLEFRFMEAQTFVSQTQYVARTLQEFGEGLRNVSIRSIYYHMFETRLLDGPGIMDFSTWLEESLGFADLAQKFRRMDPYTQTLDGLRRRLIGFVESKIQEGN